MSKYCTIEAPYPEAGVGEKRIVFALDPQGEDDEMDGWMLQLIPGRMTRMSQSEAAADTQVLEGTVEEKVVEGWGYPYYRVELGDCSTSEPSPADGGAAGGEEEVEEEQVTKFVTISSQATFPYNSKVPVVVYLPKDAELRYSIWTATEVVPVKAE